MVRPNAKGTHPMRSRRTFLAAVSVLAAGGTKTVVRQVIVRASRPAAQTEPLSVNEIYRRAYKGVVEITVSSQGSGESPFPGGGSAQRSQGSGFVYDSKGDIVTNQHVVDSASSISVRFWNGKSY